MNHTSAPCGSRGKGGTRASLRTPGGEPLEHGLPRYGAMPCLDASSGLTSVSPAYCEGQEDRKPVRAICPMSWHPQGLARDSCSMKRFLNRVVRGSRATQGHSRPDWLHVGTGTSRPPAAAGRPGLLPRDAPRTLLTATSSSTEPNAGNANREGLPAGSSPS